VNRGDIDSTRPRPRFRRARARALRLVATSRAVAGGSALSSPLFPLLPCRPNLTTSTPPSPQQKNNNNPTQAFAARTAPTTTRAAAAARRATIAPSRPSVTAHYRITFKYPDGSKPDQVVECGPDTLILDAADEASLDLPYCCRTGTCCVCAVRVQEGECERQQPQYVDDAAAAKGFALLCSTFPRSDMVLLTNQEQQLFAEEIGDYAHPETAKAAQR
jgi:2Fe-2S type ferredoxin